MTCICLGAVWALRKLALACTSLPCACVTCCLGSVGTGPRRFHCGRTGFAQRRRPGRTAAEKFPAYRPVACSERDRFAPSTCWLPLAELRLGGFELLPRRGIAALALATSA